MSPPIGGAGGNSYGGLVNLSNLGGSPNTNPGPIGNGFGAFSMGGAPSGPSG